jgi:hypothetical protein
MCRKPGHRVKAGHWLYRLLLVCCGIPALAWAAEEAIQPLEGYPSSGTTVFIGAAAHGERTARNPTN